MCGPMGLGGLVATRASPAGPFCIAIAKGDGLTLRGGLSHALSLVGPGVGEVAKAGWDPCGWLLAALRVLPSKQAPTLVLSRVLSLPIVRTHSFPAGDLLRVCRDAQLCPTPPQTGLNEPRALGTEQPAGLHQTQAAKGRRQLGETPAQERLEGANTSEISPRPR